MFPYGTASIAAWPYGLSGTAYIIRNILREQHCDYDEWSWRNFTSLTDLCSAQGNYDGNMGGTCEPPTPASAAPAPKFDTRVARTALLYNDNLLRYCKQECFCAENEDDWLASDLWAVIYDQGIVRADLPELPPEPQPTSPSSMWSSFENALPLENANQQQILSYAGPTFRCTVTDRRTPRQSVRCSCQRSRVNPALARPPAPPRPPSRLPFHRRELESLE
ncbi:hypothetical protein MMC26_005172 [Xylographa opegraphella]|nr:hypothetical protein [Xylographa opegraphella]